MEKHKNEYVQDTVAVSNTKAEIFAAFRSVSTAVKQRPSSCVSSGQEASRGFCVFFASILNA